MNEIPDSFDSGDLARPKLRVLHGILGVEADSNRSLIEAHLLALRSIELAVDAGAKYVDVERKVLVTEASFDYVRHGFTTHQLPSDARAIFGQEFRPLAFASEVFEHLGASDTDFVIVSNADIGLFQNFYREVARLSCSGVYSWTSHRRTIPQSPPDHEDSLAWVERQEGLAHEGSDLFVTTPSVATKMSLGSAVFGMPGIGDLVLTNLAAFDPTFIRFRNRRLSFHIEDERLWQIDSRSEENDAHNKLLQAAARNLRRSIGSIRYHAASRKAGLGRFSRKRLAGRLSPSEWGKNSA